MVKRRNRIMQREGGCTKSKQVIPEIDFNY